MDISLPQTLPPFEELVKLARKDSRQFEKLTREIINNEIAMSKSHKLHLERIQFRLDGIYRKHKNPITRCQLLLSMIADDSLKVYHVLEPSLKSNCAITEADKPQLTIVKC